MITSELMHGLKNDNGSDLVFNKRIVGIIRSKLEHLKVALLGEGLLDKWEEERKALKIYFFENIRKFYIEKVKNQMEVTTVISEDNSVFETTEETSEDGRKHNGRREVTSLSRCFTDDFLWNMAAYCYEKYFRIPLSATQDILCFLSTFASAIDDLLYRVHETMTFKLAYLHRLAEKKLGKLTGCSLRYLQKAYRWLIRKEEKSSSSNPEAVEASKKKMKIWVDLEQMILNQISDTELYCSVVNPH